MDSIVNILHCSWNRSPTITVSSNEDLHLYTQRLRLLLNLYLSTLMAVVTLHIQRNKYGSYFQNVLVFLFCTKQILWVYKHTCRCTPSVSSFLLLGFSLFWTQFLTYHRLSHLFTRRVGRQSEFVTYFILFNILVLLLLQSLK